QVVSVQPTDASGGGMLVSRRSDDGHLDVRVVYVREFVLQCSASPYASLPPPNLSKVVLEMNEIVAKFPSRFQAALYSKRHNPQLDRHLLHRRA
uniref:Uncharacterized protein n=1 Tax=Plectus sambesii TaxID=2011161 RepID=A0A914W6E5_9BILA